MEKSTMVVIQVEVVAGESQTLELTDYVPDWVFYHEIEFISVRLPKRRMEVSESDVRE